MSKRKDLSGERFGRLVVLKYCNNNKYGRAVWECECSCQKKTITLVTSNCLLREGGTQSCGCLQKEMMSATKTTHGKSKTVTYKRWAGMINRCYNSKDSFYYCYGGRGIKVCDQWLKFEGFYEDMGECPTGLSIDRIDNNDNYYKENCRWATNKEQSRNKRNNRIIKFNNKTQCLQGWAEEIGVSEPVLCQRLKKWTIEDAVTMPLNTSPNEIKVTFNGKTNSLRNFAELYSQPYQLVYDRIKKLNWDIEDALTIPVGETNKIDNRI
jgi:hypothetical protein